MTKKKNSEMHVDPFLCAHVVQYLQWSTGTGLEPFNRPLAWGLPILEGSTSRRQATLLLQCVGHEQNRSHKER